MSQAAALQKWEVERLPGWNVPGWLRGEDVVLYGEPLFVSVVAPALGVEVLQPSYDFLPKLPQKYLRRAVRLIQMAEARQLPVSAFIKPVDDKCFPAGIYASGAALPPNSVVPDSELVLVSDPVEWSVEFRTFALERRVVAMSPYLREGELAVGDDNYWSASEQEKDGAMDFCQNMLSDKDVACPPAFVLDVGIIKGTGWAVVEANPAWGSGLYASDSAEVLKVLRRACAPAGQFAPEDDVWIRR
jgi:hypothetical protein